jgi:hypothetical protein
MGLRSLIAIAVGIAVVCFTQWSVLPAMTWLLPLPTPAGSHVFWPALIVNALQPLASVVPGFCAGWISWRRGLLIGALTGLLGSAAYGVLFTAAGLGWFWSIGPGLILTCGAGGAAAEVLRSNNRWRGP